MKKTTSWVVFVLVTFLVFLQGCATDKPFVKRDLTTITPLKVVRDETPGFIKDTVGRRLSGFLLFGAIGSAISTSAGGKTMREELSLPDFGQLVMKKFVERANKEIPNWPAMNVEDQPIGEEYSYKSGGLLVFSVKTWGVAFKGFAGIGGHEFFSTTNVKLVELGDNVLWEKNFTYKSKEFNRNRPMEEFEADNGKLLKEEIEFAADKTVSDFIEHFKK